MNILKKILYPLLMILATLIYSYVHACEDLGMGEGGF